LIKQEQVYGMDNKEQIRMLKNTLPIKRKLSIPSTLILPPIN
jgi:hypothetical protein